MNRSARTLARRDSVAVRWLRREVGYDLKRIFTNGQGSFDGDLSSPFATSDCRRSNSPHQIVSMSLSRNGSRASAGISNAEGSYLRDVRLRSARKLDPISRIRWLSENDPADRDPCRHHPFRDLVTEICETFQHGSPSGGSVHPCAAATPQILAYSF